MKRTILHHRLLLAALLAIGCMETGLGGVSARLVVQTESGERDSSGRYVLDFGSVVVNTTGARTATAIDTGRASLILQAPVVTPPFTVDLLTAKELAGAGHVDLTFTFSPTSLGPTEQIVELRSDGGNATVILKGTAVEPSTCEFVVNPMAIDFGTVLQNDSKTLAVQFAAIGGADCVLSNIQIDSDSGPEFALSARQVTDGIASAIGGSFPLEVTFTAMAPGDATGKLSLRVGPDGDRVEVPLKGTSTELPCVAVVTPALVGFLSVTPGTTATQTIEVRAAAGARCIISEVLLDGASDPTFSLLAGQPTSGEATATVPFLIPVSFAPVSQATNVPGRVLLKTSPPETLVEVPLIGNVIPCSFTLVPATGDFGDVIPGIPGTQIIQLNANGTQDCKVSNLHLDPATAPEFALASGQPVSGVATPGHPFQIAATFSPLLPTATESTGAIVFNLSPPEKTVSLPLTAHAICPMPEQNGSCPATLDVQPVDVDFGPSQLGCGSLARSITLFASGDNPVVVQSFDLLPMPPPELFYGTLPATPFPIGPGQRVTIPLRFRPDAPTTHTGGFAVHSNATNGAVQTVALHGLGTTSAHQTDTFTESQTLKTDLLFIIDDSGSMSEEQGLLADNALTFIQIADMLHADYQIGVTTTDISSRVGGRFQGNPRIVRPGPNAANQFASTVRSLGIMGSSSELGLEAMRLALSAPLINDSTANGGFLRPDARLAVIVVSDEEDQSTGSVTDFANFLLGLKGVGNEAMVSFSAVVGPDRTNGGPGCISGNGEADEGARYIAMQKRTNGFFRSICLPDWGAIATDLGLNVFMAAGRYSLTRPADPSTIVVRVNGQIIPTTDYMFEAAQNAIRFLPNTFPATGMVVTVEYDAACQ